MRCTKFQPLVSVITLIAAALLRSKTVDGSTSSTSLERFLAPKFPLPGISPDRWVLAAPLTVGIVCQDGVLIMAFHSNLADDNEESFLLYNDFDNSHDDDFADAMDAAAIDLPKSYGGPFRIYPISESVAMTCTGWRIDGQVLAEMVQATHQSEKQMFGMSPAESRMEHSSYLASHASHLMAEFCVEGGIRALSTAGLMGSSDALWLVDATGAYRVRACALGGGQLAGQVNNYLQKREWTTLTSNDVAKELLRTLYDDIPDDKRDSDSPRDTESGDTERIRVPKGSVVEMMKIGRNGEMMRLFFSSLSGRPSAAATNAVE